MLLCESLAAILASRSNRLMNSLFLASDVEQDLDGDDPVDAGLPGLEDDPHRALAELRSRIW